MWMQERICTFAWIDAVQIQPLIADVTIESLDEGRMIVDVERFPCSAFSNKRWKHSLKFVQSL